MPPIRFACYSWARKRLCDGFDYSSLDKIRGIERWIAYSMAPAQAIGVRSFPDPFNQTTEIAAAKIVLVGSSAAARMTLAGRRRTEAGRVQVPAQKSYATPTPM